MEKDSHVNVNTTEDASSIDLYNDSVNALSWSSISVILQQKKNDALKPLLSNINGEAKAGELVAVMGPSGCGKTTLLNRLAYRQNPAGSTLTGDVRINEVPSSLELMRQASCYVEQEDSLIGSLTAWETLDFAAKLSLPGSITKADRNRRVDHLLSAFGLQDQANTLVGTPIRKGLSGGQKRRVGIASQLITCPRILFLDEPTSGLDSAASYEVMSYLKEVVRSSNIIVVASIHQPSTSTFNLFDKIYLLSEGQMCYHGPISSIREHFASLGHPVPLHVNPAEFLLDLVNVDFSSDKIAERRKVQKICDASSLIRQTSETHFPYSSPTSEGPKATTISIRHRKSAYETASSVAHLVHRSFIKSYRDVFAYGIRVAMYMGLAIMMGTVWLRLDTTQENIQPFINALFFGSAFLSFMAVAYVPSYLEDRSTYKKEHANGLYGPLSFTLANFIIGVPYLFLIAILFCIVTYFLCNFRPGAAPFFTYTMWLFLDLLAAEGLVVLVSSLFPIFVVSLALTAFANGLWMSVGGFLVSPSVINVFWRYWARYIDYQSYVFRGMMINEFSARTYDCAQMNVDGVDKCHCMYSSSLESQCKIDGQAVLDTYGYAPGDMGKWVGIMIAIIFVYRVLGYIVLRLKKS